MGWLFLAITALRQRQNNNYSYSTEPHNTTPHQTFGAPALLNSRAVQQPQPQPQPMNFFLNPFE
jgi:hypothetical protein